MDNSLDIELKKKVYDGNPIIATTSVHSLVYPWKIIDLGCEHSQPGLLPYVITLQTFLGAVMLYS